MLNIHHLPDLVNRLFPGNSGLLLTGSQRENISLIKEKDIDVVVLSGTTGNMVHYILHEGGYIFDFALLPVTDISSVMDSECYDSKGVLINQLVKGIIIEDKYGLVRIIKDRATELYGKAVFGTTQLHRQQVLHLQKFNKYFQNRTDQYGQAARQSILCDWYTAITATEAFKLVHYMHGPFHKYQLLMVQAPAFMQEVTAALQEAMQNDNFKPVADYNLLYTNTMRAVNKYEPPAGADVTIDIGYENFSMQGFVAKALPALLENPDIAASYKYFFASPVKYYRKYQHKVCLCFSIQPGKMKYYALPPLVRSILESDTEIKDPKYSVLFDTRTEHRGSAIIEELRRGMSSGLSGHIQAGSDWDPHLLMHLGLTLLGVLQSATGIEKNDLFKAVACLMQNWIFGNPKPIRTSQLGTLRNKYEKAIKMAESYYSIKWASYLPSMVQSGLFHFPPGLVHLPGLVQSSARAFMEYPTPADGASSDISYQVCKSLQFGNVDAAYCYLTFAEEIFTFLNLGYPQRLMALYAYFKASGTSTDTTLRENNYHLA
jgi:hypothetical protein